MPREEVLSLMEKYKQRLSEQLKVPSQQYSKPVYSREYQQFRLESMPKQFTLYEKICRFSESVLKIKPDAKKAVEIQEALDACHLNITPAGVVSSSILIPILVIVFGSLLSFAVFKSLFFVGFFVIAGLVLLMSMQKIPFFLADTWRMKTSNQMVLCIFYVVTFMRHTSNLELAVEFASEHLAPPLSLDLKKVLWDVETGKFESIKESLDSYLDSWKKWNIEFVEAVHLVESSLYEPSESRRLDLLDKSLDVILSETYEKMLHYAHNLNSPITMLHMLGVIMPILGLVILPLAVNFLGNIQWYHIALLYNIAIPVSVYFLGRSILSKRPTGYGDTDISEENPELKKYRNILFRFGNKEFQINPLVIGLVIGIILLFIGLSPVIVHALNPDFEIEFTPNFRMMEYRESRAIEGPMVGTIIGPFGLGAAMLSFFVVLAFGIGIGLYFRLRSKDVIKIRNKAKELEKEFASALFQLGNRLGDGLPAEIAFGKVASVMSDTVSGRFFDLVSSNISRLGMSVEDAIFNPRSGAIVYFPSRIIESSMKVLIESIKKGPVIAAQALMNIARYIKEIHKVDERLKDLLGEVVSSMKSQISFLTPAIAGIVIGITSMVTTILGRLSEQMAAFQSGGESVPGIQTGMLDMFGDGIPTYHFQIIVGIYVVQLAYILTIMSNGVENGSDKLAERYSLGKNLIRSSVLYCFIALVVMLIFNLIAGSIMKFTVS
jgi:hypothetical protein